MKAIKHHFKNKSYVASLVSSFIFLFVALVVNFYAGTNATADASNYVTDIVLSNIPVFDVDGVFVWGAFVLVGCITLVCISHPHKIPFTLKAISLFVLIRDVFISITHLAPFPTAVVIDPLSYANYFMFGGDLFFSGHTGLPFLMALIYWDNKVLRTSFTCFSVLLGGVSLMGHLHYSIDVLAAFFITYSIYHLSERLFKKDKELKKAEV